MYNEREKGETMRRNPRLTIGYLALIGMLWFTSVVQATVYHIPKITHIFTDGSGRVGIKWNGSPNPGPCGKNYGWVVFPPSAAKEQKALALALYMSGKPARVDTSGCLGKYEIVSTLYSPNG